MQSVDIRCTDSDLITSHKETPQRGVQGVGSDNNNLHLRGECRRSALQANLRVEIGLLKCYLNKSNCK